MCCKEKRVYLCIWDTDFDFRGAEHRGDYDAIKQEAEKQGHVYSLEYFMERWNNEELNCTNSFILID